MSLDQKVFSDSKHNRVFSCLKPLFFHIKGNREEGTLNREQIRNFSSEFRASVKKKCFLRCVARKKTVSLFQSHVFKHEFFLLRVPR